MRAIDFKDKRFRTKEDYNLLTPLTENTMRIFKGSNKVWEDGKDEVYKMICNGRYGTYDGKWVDLHGEYWDKEAHNCIAEINMYLDD